MDLDKILSMYNDEGLSLSVIGEKLSRSKSTISNRLAKGGYIRNNVTGKYEKNVSRETLEEQLNIETNVLNETDSNRNKENNETNVSSEIIEEMVNRTYLISSKIDKAMKIKSAVEGKKPIDIVREALKAYIEQKYFDM